LVSVISRSGFATGLYQVSYFLALNALCEFFDRDENYLKTSLRGRFRSDQKHAAKAQAGLLLCKCTLGRELAACWNSLSRQFHCGWRQGEIGRKSAVCTQ